MRVQLVLLVNEDEREVCEEIGVITKLLEALRNQRRDLNSHHHPAIG